MKPKQSVRISVEQPANLESHEPDLWVSCHGYESRSISHLELPKIDGARRISFGFNFPDFASEPLAAERILSARTRLADEGYEVPIVDDATFEFVVRKELALLAERRPYRLRADVSSMSRSRIASLLLACFENPWLVGCELEIVYYPGSYASHKHQLEPLEFFGPCHGLIAGWPSEPDLPLALLVGLGTEPKRADGVVEMLEPDILAVYLPIGDEPAYLDELRRENRRVLEVGGEPVMYSLRDTTQTYGALLSTASQLVTRARVVIVPLGPKLFSAMAMLVALSIGPEVGVWKASAGRHVQPVDVARHGAPIVLRVRMTIL